MECTKCGACCVAPDIAALGKPLGLACPHLGPDNLCKVYEDRPQVCRDYEPDELCNKIVASTLDARVKNYLEIFDLLDEANEVRQARKLPVLK